MKKAIIDLGTNTFNLLIANVEGLNIEELHSEKEGVAIGMGGINSGIIADEAMERAIVALTKFKSICEDQGIENIWAFGTSAIRDAANKEVFLNRVLNEVGLKIQVLSGQEEAELIYEGVAALPGCPENGVVLDIGGGSSEVIVLAAHDIHIAKSLNIGVSRIYQMFEFSDPLSAEDQQKIETYLEEESAKLTPWPKQEILIGSSGSFETMYELINDHVFPHDPEFYELNMDDFNHQLDRMIASTLAERKSRQTHHADSSNDVAHHGSQDSLVH